MCAKLAWAAVAATVALGGLTGPSAAQTAAPATPTPPPAAVQPAAPQLSDYRLGPGDKVRVSVFGEESLSGEFYVGSNGKLSLPLVGDVQAGGLSVAGFQDEVTRILSDGWLKQPKVSTEVLTYRPFFILGEVAKPGQYPYTAGLTVQNAVATAGGFTYRANKGRVFIQHVGETVEREVEIEPRTPVAPGDTIRITERFF